MVAGKRIAVDVTTLKRRGPREVSGAKPRLRFDKVATRLIAHLQATLGEVAPDGTTVLVTVTAPIRLAARTATSLEEKIEALLGRRSPGRDAIDTIHGNRVRIRLLRVRSARAPKVIGFVHNAGSDPVLLFNLTREVLDLVGAESSRRRPGRGSGRSLVVTSARGSSCLEAYRYIYSLLRPAAASRKIAMVFEDGRVGMLTA